MKSAAIASAGPAPTSGGAPAVNPRTQALLTAPIVPTLLRLGAPNVLVMLAQAAVGLIETYFVGQLGGDALAGMALVFPVVMLMQMTSAGAMGGGIASAIARALGAQRRDDANALVQQSMWIALGFGTLFMLAMLGGGRWLYGRMGGTGGALEAALVYSNWVFAGAVLVWIFNSLSAVIRGTGNMMVPAVVVVVGTVVLIPLSAVLIFGWGPLPGLGIAGGAIALLSYYAIGSLVLLLYLNSPASLLRPRWLPFQLRWALCWDILRVGLAGTISTVATNLAIGITTALVGGFGTAAIAGYGTAARLEYLMVPLVFGLGAPLVAMVGTCMGAGQRERAVRAAWTGAVLSFAMAEGIGLLAAAFPEVWLRLFTQDAQMIEAGRLYLRAVGPAYGFFGLGLVLYFASQGAGKLLWPVIGNITRLVIAAAGGWLALHWFGSLTALFVAQALALVAYGLVNASAIAGGAWFGPLGWPRSPAGLMRRLAA
jgi:putative MATE family efflux protein